MCKGRVWRIAVPMSAIVNGLFFNQASVKGKYTNTHIIETSISFRTSIMRAVTMLFSIFACATEYDSSLQNIYKETISKANSQAETRPPFDH